MTAASEKAVPQFRQPLAAAAFLSKADADLGPLRSFTVRVNPGKSDLPQQKLFNP